MVIKDERHYFYACDGAVIKNIKEMLDWFEKSSDDSFITHVNSDKNDFGGWVKEILKDNVLAKKITKTKSREAIIKTIEERIAFKTKSKRRKDYYISQIKEAVSHDLS